MECTRPLIVTVDFFNENEFLYEEKFIVRNTPLLNYEFLLITHMRKGKTYSKGIMKALESTIKAF